MNPFKLLNVDAGASKKEIIQAVARAMREKAHTGRELATAQKLLLDPVARATQEFLHLVDVKSLLEAMHLEKPPAVEGNDMATLTCLDLFDERK